jgi:hypothetical protein
MPPCLPIIKNVVPEIKFPFQEARMFGTKFRYIVLTVKHCFSSYYKRQLLPGVFE